MATTIENFYYAAQGKQFSRDFFMRVKELQLPGLSFNGENDLLYARTVSLPGRTIEDKLVNFAGQVFHLNGRSTYDNSDSFTVEFYMDGNLDIRSALEEASRKAFNNKDTTGQFCMPGADSYMLLDVLKAPCSTGNPGGEPLTNAKSIRFEGVNIRNIGPVEYQIADGTGEIQKLTCTFSFHWYDQF